MALTAAQHRARSANQRCAYLVRIDMPDDSVIMICDNDEDLALDDSLFPNPLLKEITGLDLGSLGEVSDIRIVLANKKIVKQSGNPLAGPIKISDLMADGLNLATVTVKRLNAAVKPIPITAWDSTDLDTVFVGRLKGKAAVYGEDEIALAGTVSESAADVDIPKERIGEHTETDPEGDQTVLPYHFGNNRAWIDYWGAHNEPALCSNIRIGRHLLPTPAPIWKYPESVEGVAESLVVSVKGMAAIDDLTVSFPELARPCIVPRAINSGISAGRERPETSLVTQWQERTHSTYGYHLIDLIKDKNYICYYPMRCTADPEVTASAQEQDWRELAKKCGRVALTDHGDHVRIATPQVTPPADSVIKALLFYVQMGTLPEGAHFILTFSWFMRDSSTGPVHLRTKSVMAVAIDAGGFWTDFADFSDMAAAMADARDWTAEDRWGFCSNRDGIRVTAYREDSNGGTAYITGIYCIAFFIQPWATQSNTESPRGRMRYPWQRPSPIGADLPVPVSAEMPEPEIAFGSGGDGVATSEYEPTSRQCHPRHLVHYMLTEEMGVSEANIDLEDRVDYYDTRDWQFGFGLVSPKKRSDILAELQEQATAYITKDCDGTYRMRLMARYNAYPDWQRFDHSLVLDQDIWGIEVECPGSDAVANVIRVNYAPDANGSFALAAWVNPQSSGDGYGNRDQDLEALAAASQVDHGWRTKTINAWAVRDPVTAVGIRNYWLIRMMAPPSAIVRFYAGGIGRYIHVGQYIPFSHTILDTRLKLNGSSWYGKWFQVTKKMKHGEAWRIYATACPESDALSGYILITRPVIIGSS